MKRYVMGVDHGGTNVKAVLFDMDGRAVASAKRSIPMQTPRPGFTERDMEELWRMNCEVIRETVETSGADPADIAGVSFSGHGKGLYLWGKDDRPVRPGIVSTDSRAYEVVERWYRDGVAQRVYPRICQSLLASQPAALLRWLDENEPGTLEKIRYVFDVKDYIRYRMTGEARSEITDVSGSGLLNLPEARFDVELLKEYGLESIADKLPPLIGSMEACGQVTESCARETGLVPGTVVTGGLFDIDACAIGMDICDNSRIAVIAGTWAINEYITRTPVTDGSVKMNSLYCLPGYYLAEECSPTSASNYDWMLKTFMEEAAAAKGEDLYAWGNAMAGSAGPDSESIIFLPYLYGGTDDPRTKSAFVGLEAWHNRAQVLRAVCEGVVFGHKRQVERLQKSRPVPAEAVRLAGGVVHSDLWVQMFADILGLPVETIDVDELGALGAAMTAAVACGAYPSLEEAARAMVKVNRVCLPNPALRDVYAAKYEKYLRVERTLSQLHRELEG